MRSRTSITCRLNDLRLSRILQVGLAVCRIRENRGLTDWAQTREPAEVALGGPSDQFCNVSASPLHCIMPVTKCRACPDAWHVVANADPLADSDEELMDEHVRNDYSERHASVSCLFMTLSPLTISGHRVDVIARLRGRPPTPPPDPMLIEGDVAPYSISGVSDTREHRWRTVESWK